MATTAALFKARFPEFASVADARVELFLADAALVMDTTIWGDVYDLGQSYLTAHYLSLAESSAASGGSTAVSGPVTGRTVDGVSVTYGTSTAIGTSSNAAYWQQTVYGQRYATLLKNLGANVLIA